MAEQTTDRLSEYLLDENIKEKILTSIWSHFAEPDEMNSIATIASHIYDRGELSGIEFDMNRILEDSDSELVSEDILKQIIGSFISSVMYTVASGTERYIPHEVSSNTISKPVLEINRDAIISETIYYAASAE